MSGLLKEIIRNRPRLLSEVLHFYDKQNVKKPARYLFNQIVNKSKF